MRSEELAKQRHVPPSRTRYEANHPAVTARVSKELFAELKVLKKQAGLSVADVLKIGLEKSKPRAGEAYEKGYQEGGEEGFVLGWGQAEEEYEVTYWCASCRRRHLSITTDEEKEAAAALMYQAGWHSTVCGGE